MIRIMLAAIAYCSALSAATADLIATVDMPVLKVSEHAYYANGVPRVATDNQGFVSNAGVVVTDAGVVVFDTLGTPALARLLLKKIAAITDKPVVKVLVSHYHADHVYGLQVFEDIGAEIIAPIGAENYLDSDAAMERLEERRVSLHPWVDDTTRLVAPDRFVESGEQFELGGVRFTVDVVGAAHSDGDLTLFVEPDRILFSGDIIFEGRIPFVGNADSKHWLQTLEKMDTDGLAALVPGHGPANKNPGRAIELTRRYLAYLRETMGLAVEDFEPFDEVYERTDWSAFSGLPTFREGNRRNAYGVYLSLEKELIDQ